MYRNSMNVSVETPQVYKKVISIPESIEIEIKDHCVYIIGKLGNLMHRLHQSVNVTLIDLKYINIYSNNINMNNKALIGTTRSLINNMVIGVTSGFTKTLQLVGIGYKANIDTKNVINLTIGLSHSVDYALPKGINAECLNQTEIILTGINKQLIGQVAANLRAIRPPEPFKGKGIRYLNEIIDIKDTKKR